MLSALGQVLPIAVAVAFSSVPITATILILLSPKRNISGAAFLVGWVAGLIIVVSAATFGAQALPITSLRTQQSAFGVTEIVIGAALVILGIVSGLRAVRHPTPAQGAKWLTAVKSFGPRPSFGLAVVLNFRPKGLLLGVAAGLAIGGDATSAGDALGAIAFYVVISASTVAVPIISTIAMPELMQPRLVDAQHWLEQHGRLVTALLMGLIGVVILGVGLGQL
ncbi:MAG TPA: GAP family protein [Microlunatus sp.]|nr:GAP family protein [Microlunatus sp.]